MAPATKRGFPSLFATRSARIVHEELALRDAGRAEGIRFDDVGARLEKAAMDVPHHLGLRQREEIAVVQQIFAGLSKARAADVGFAHVVGAQRGAHRPVDDGDSVLEQAAEGMKSSGHG